MDLPQCRPCPCDLDERGTFSRYSLVMRKENCDVMKDVQQLLVQCDLPGAEFLTHLARLFFDLKVRKSS